MNHPSLTGGRFELELPMFLRFERARGSGARLGVSRPRIR